MKTLTGKFLVPAALSLAGSTAFAVPVALDTTSSFNGLSDIYSVTFDGALVPCGGGDPAYCAFFGGKPGSPARAIVISPGPTGLATTTPAGVLGAGPGSFLNLNINGGNLELTGGTVALDPFTLTIGGTTTVTPSGVAGFVIAPALQTAALNGSGQAEFLVNLVPATAADFSTFTSIVAGPYAGAGPDCFGPLCLLIPGLTLDMVRYRLFVDYDPTFTTFTADFIGQTPNNSLVSARLNSVPLPAAAWLMLSGLGVLAGLRRRVFA